jgi:hypothetical protein
VRAAAAVLACWNHVIPYLCPELPASQKQALAYGVKIPLIYTNVQLGVLSPSVKKTSLRHVHVNSASKALASFKSAVSKPSVHDLEGEVVAKQEGGG